MLYDQLSMIFLYELRKRKTRAKFPCQFAANRVYRSKNSAAGGFDKSAQATDLQRIPHANRVDFETGKNVFPAVREIPGAGSVERVEEGGHLLSLRCIRKPP